MRFRFLRISWPVPVLSGDYQPPLEINDSYKDAGSLGRSLNPSGLTNQMRRYRQGKQWIAVGRTGELTVV